MEDLIKITIRNINALKHGNVKMMVEVTSSRAAEKKTCEEV